MKRRPFSLYPFTVAAEVLEFRSLLAAVTPGNILDHLASITPVTASTIPANGDVNLYGLAFVPADFATGGSLNPGDLLVRISMIPATSRGREPRLSE